MPYPNNTYSFWNNPQDKNATDDALVALEFNALARREWERLYKKEFPSYPTEEVEQQVERIKQFLPVPTVPIARIGEKIRNNELDIRKEKDKLNEEAISGLIMQNPTKSPDKIRENWFNSPLNQEDPTPLEKALNPDIYGKKYLLNSWEKGLDGLSEEDANKWREDNKEKIEGKSDAYIDRLWRNQQFSSVFGSNNLKNYKAAERDELMKKSLLDKEILQDHKSNKNIGRILNLTNEGKEEFLESDYLNDMTLSSINNNEHKKGWSDYSFEELWNAAYKDAIDYGKMGAEEGAAIGVAVGGWAGLGVAGTVEGLTGVVYGSIKGLFNPWDANDVNISNRNAKNDSILNMIIESDNERKKNKVQPDIDKKIDEYEYNLAKGNISEESINKEFDKLVTKEKRTIVDEFGKTHEYEYQGSNYYNAFKNSDEFEGFGVHEKIKTLAQAEILAQNYGIDNALEILDKDMANVVYENQTALDWFGNTLKNFAVGGIANIAQKINGIQALATKINYGLYGAVTHDGNFIDNYEKYGNEALGNFLQGKDASGNGEKNDSWRNPEYWDKVDQYNTFGWDQNSFFGLGELLGWEDEMARAEANGGISRHTNIYKPGTENDFFSYATLNNAIAMAKFAWSDAFTNYGLAKIIGKATSIAGGVETAAPGILATESSTASKIINKAGSFGIVNFNSVGIDTAYGMQTFNDVLSENNAKIDAMIKKDTDIEAKRRLASPKIKKEFKDFVNQENERRQKEAKKQGKNNYVPVNLEKAWDNYSTMIYNEVKREQEELHKEDRKEAERDAADAFATDATIEHIRMAPTAVLFKNYLFDKGTLNALKLNNPYVNTTTKDGMYTLGKHAYAKKVGSTIAQNVWAGAQSNYFDDVTVGFAEGFGIQKFNNYLYRKYNPAAYGSIIDNYVSPFIAGINGAEETAKSKRAFLDGFIGGIGSVFTIMPNVGGIRNHSNRMKEAAEQQKEDAENGFKTSKISKLEKASDFITNPILTAFAEAKTASRMTERQINKVNKIIKENKYALDNITETATALNMKAVTREGSSIIEAEDEKDRGLFTLASELLTLKNNKVVVNAQVEPDKAIWSKKKKMANIIGSGIKTLLGLSNSQQAESSYTKAMTILELASTIMEDANSEEEAYKKQELINTFLGLESNQNIINNMSREDQVQFAKERLKKNADGILNMMNNLEHLQEKLDNSIVVGKHPDLKKQLMFQYVLDNRWKTRLQELEGKITGEQTVEEDVEEWYKEKMKTFEESSSPIAKYGSLEGFNKAYKAQEDKIDNLETKVKRAKINTEKGNDPTKSLIENMYLKKQRRMTLKKFQKELSKAKEELKQMDSERSIFEETNKEDNTKRILPLEIISAENILRLNPTERFRMLDDYYRGDYSEEQIKEIVKAQNLLIGKLGDFNTMMETVRDAAVLKDRISDNMETAKTITKNPSEAAAMLLALENNRKSKVIDYFNNKVIKEAFDKFTNSPSITLTDEDIAEKLKDTSSAILFGMLNTVKKELQKRDSDRTNNLDDLVLQNFMDGINIVLSERNERTKDILDIDKFIAKTDKIEHTIENPISSEDENIKEKITEEIPLTPNDRKLLYYALDYAIERNIPLEKLTEEVGTDNFSNYILERNHSYQTVGEEDSNGDLIPINVKTAETMANEVSPAYMQDLVTSVVNAYNKNKEVTKNANAEKVTTSIESVVTPPVTPTNPQRTEEVRPDEKPTSDDSLGIKKEPKETKTDTPITETPSKEPAEGPKSKNQEVLDNPLVQQRNSKILGGIKALLDKVDAMEMSDEARDTIKNAASALVENQSFETTKELQDALFAELAAENPEVFSKANALRRMNLEEKKKDEPVEKNDSQENTPKEPSLSTSISSIDLDSILTNPKAQVLIDYIKKYNMVAILNKLSEAWQEGFKKWNFKGEDEKTHKTQVIFLYDEELAQNIEKNIEEQREAEVDPEKKKKLVYTPETQAPIIAAIEIREGVNDDIIEDKSLIIVPKNIPDQVKGQPKLLGYWPIGIMPRSGKENKETGKHDEDSFAIEPIRNKIDYSKGTQVISMPPASATGKNGSPIKTSISAVETHTEDENIPHSTTDTPNTSVDLLMNDNVNSPTETIVEASDEEKETYNNAKTKFDIRKTNLYRKFRDAFISRLSKATITTKGGDEAKALKFKIYKGTKDTREIPVFIKKIGDTIDKNSDRSIVDLLKEVTSSISDILADNLINSNSRIRRLFNVLSNTKFSAEVANRVFDNSGNIRNAALQSEYNRELATFEGNVKSAIENNFNVDELSVKASVETINGEKIVKVDVYSGEQTEENRLSTLTTKLGNNLSKAEFSMFLRDLILDKEGNTRKGIKDDRYERVKWQVNYEDAARANDPLRSKEERKVAKDNFDELFDDGIFEMPVTKLAYKARRVTVSLNNKMQALYHIPEKNNPADEHPSGTIETKDGNLDGDTGAVLTPVNTREDVEKAIPVNITSAINKLIEDSKNRKLTEDGKHYNILGQLWSRVTSIKHTLPNFLKNRFNPQNAWSLPSTKIGNSFDDFGRDVFNHLFDKKSADERKTSFEDYDNSTAQNYEETYQRLKAFEARLLNDGKIIIGTIDPSTGQAGQITTKGLLNVTVEKEDGTKEVRQVRVAGTLDVLAIDKDGNLHIYDFKTKHNGGLDEAKAVEEGYDRQLSMYAQFLEDELAPYGVKVKSINIIPVDVTYPTPSGMDNNGSPITGAQATFKESNRQGSNQLLVKNVGADDASFTEFNGANFQVQEEFPLTRLTGDALTASMEKMTAEEKMALVEAVKDQAAKNTDAEVKVEGAEMTEKKAEPKMQEAAKNGLGGAASLLARLKQKKASEGTEAPKADTSPEGTAEAIKPTEGVKAQIDELKNRCKE